MSQRADVVIIGGGVIGSSIGYHLRHDGFTGRVVIIERDPSYARASSSLAMGGIRQQFGAAVNVAMAKYSIEFYRRFDDRMGVLGRRPNANFRQRGYLFLADDRSSDRLERRFNTMSAAGAHVRRLSTDAVRHMLPDAWLDDIRFGVFGPDDGYANPKEVLRGFRDAAEAAGVEYVDASVSEVRAVNARVSGVAVGNEIVDSPVVVNAAGPYAARVAELAGVRLPVEPVRQHLFRCALPHDWPYRFPMVIDPGGTHWRHDDASGTKVPDQIIVAKTRMDEPAGENFVCDSTRWSDDMFPDLIRRMPAFKDLKLEAGWAGLYEMTPDHNPMIGEHPDLHGFFLANGFSGHGLMMAPATGRAVSELIRTGLSRTLDITPYRPDRFTRGESLVDEATI